MCRASAPSGGRIWNLANPRKRCGIWHHKVHPAAVSAPTRRSGPRAAPPRRTAHAPLRPLPLWAKLMPDHAERGSSACMTSSVHARAAPSGCSGFWRNWAFPTITCRSRPARPRRLPSIPRARSRHCGPGRMSSRIRYSPHF